MSTVNKLRGLRPLDSFRALLAHAIGVEGHPPPVPPACDRGKHDRQERISGVCL